MRTKHTISLTRTQVIGMVDKTLRAVVTAKIKILEGGIAADVATNTKPPSTIISNQEEVARQSKTRISRNREEDLVGATTPSQSYLGQARQTRINTVQLTAGSNTNNTLNIQTTLITTNMSRTDSLPTTTRDFKPTKIDILETNTITRDSRTSITSKSSEAVSLTTKAMHHTDRVAMILGIKALIKTIRVGQVISKVTAEAAETYAKRRFNRRATLTKTMITTERRTAWMEIIKTSSRTTKSHTQHGK